MEQSNYDRLIIDGNNFIFRAYHTKRPAVIANGINTTPIHQFLYMLKNVVSQFRPKEIVLTWDKKLNPNGTNFRKKMVAYKEQREESDATREIYDYIDHIRPITDSLGITTICPLNFEADDIIAFVSNMDERRNIVVSSDKDLLQLVDNHVHVFLPNKNIVITPENFEEELGIAKNCFLLYKCILGDVSDNIKGLFKYGPIKAKKLAEDIVNKMGSRYIQSIIDSPLSSFNEEKFNLTSDQLDIIQRNLIIMKLNGNHEELILEYARYREQYKDNAMQFDIDQFRVSCYTYNFINFIREMGTWRALFDNTSNNDKKDLLSCISM